MTECRNHSPNSALGVKDSTEHNYQKHKSECKRPCKTQTEGNTYRFRVLAGIAIVRVESVPPVVGLNMLVGFEVSISGRLSTGAGNCMSALTSPFGYCFNGHSPSGSGFFQGKSHSLSSPTARFCRFGLCLESEPLEEQSQSGERLTSTS